MPEIWGSASKASLGTLQRERDRWSNANANAKKDKVVREKGSGESLRGKLPQIDKSQGRNMVLIELCLGIDLQG